MDYRFTMINKINEHFPQKRLWVKTRRPDDTDPKCKGVDINRNFPTHWERDGFSDDPCSDSFRGKY